jgi:hypothetical protein
MLLAPAAAAGQDNGACPGRRQCRSAVRQDLNALVCEIAARIAPPRHGINDKPFDYDYVRLPQESAGEPYGAGQRNRRRARRHAMTLNMGILAQSIALTCLAGTCLSAPGLRR